MDDFVIKVLIVDDSLFFREKIKKEISKENNIKVIGTAQDPYIARDLILELKPDVIILDVEMPKMNGIKFLQKLMTQYPIPVVVVSSNSSYILDAINAGAVDFVSKPNFNDSNDIEPFILELLTKIRIASISKVRYMKKEVMPSIQLNPKDIISEKIIAIGASTGGTEAIYQIIQALPQNIPGIMIVQHMPAVFTNMYANRLDDSFKYFNIKEAKDGDEIQNNKILIAPGNYQMKVIKGSNGKYYAKCYKGEKVNGHCPSIDVLFNSIANEAKGSAIGVLLTGMGRDGANGLLNMKKNGAYTIGQAEDTSVVYGMPKVAYEIGAVMKQAPLGQIPKHIISRCCKEKLD